MEVDSAEAADLEVPTVDIRSLDSEALVDLVAAAEIHLVVDLAQAV